MPSTYDVLLNCFDIAPDPLHPAAVESHGMAVPPGDIDYRQVITF